MPISALCILRYSVVANRNWIKFHLDSFFLRSFCCARLDRITRTRPSILLYFWELTRWQMFQKFYWPQMVNVYIANQLSLVLGEWIFEPTVCNLQCSFALGRTGLSECLKQLSVLHYCGELSWNSYELITYVHSENTISSGSYTCVANPIMQSSLLYMSLVPKDLAQGVSSLFPNSLWRFKTL